MDWILDHECTAEDNRFHAAMGMQTFTQTFLICQRRQVSRVSIPFLPDIAGLGVRITDTR